MGSEATAGIDLQYEVPILRHRVPLRPASSGVRIDGDNRALSVLVASLVASDRMAFCMVLTWARDCMNAHVD